MPNDKGTKVLLNLSKTEVSKIMGIITSHSGLQTHLKKIVLQTRASAEDVAKIMNIRILLPQITDPNILEEDFMPELNQLRDIEWKASKNFVTSTEYLMKSSFGAWTLKKLRQERK